jgi:virginiamycin B lyase
MSVLVVIARRPLLERLASVRLSNGLRPAEQSRTPYAIAVIDDVIWYNESGQRPDALVRFNPATESFQSWAIPLRAGIVRNMWVTEDKNSLIHQTSSNRIGLVVIDKAKADLFT